MTRRRSISERRFVVRPCDVSRFFLSGCWCFFSNSWPDIDTSVSTPWSRDRGERRRGECPFSRPGPGLDHSGSASAAGSSPGMQSRQPELRRSRFQVWPGRPLAFTTDVPKGGSPPGDVAEWLGTGLQNPVHRFDSGRRLDNQRSWRCVFTAGTIAVSEGALSSAW